MRAEIEAAVQLLQRGDDASDLEHALALLQNTVFPFSMRVCGQREDAEDTMQGVLLKSVPQLPKFPESKSPISLALQSGEESLPDDSSQKANLLPPKNFHSTNSCQILHGGRRCIYSFVPHGGAGTLLPLAEMKTSAAGASSFAGEHCRM
jgi:hypothetical protein